MILCNVMKSGNHIISYMTSYMIDQSQSRQLDIITDPKIDLSFIICQLTYLTISVNLFNQPFKSISLVNFFNQSILNWWHY